MGVFQGLKLPVCRVEDTIRLPWQHLERYASILHIIYQQGPLAQSVECGADNAKVVSSRLTWTIFLLLSVCSIVCYTLPLALAYIHMIVFLLC